MFRCHECFPHSAIKYRIVATRFEQTWSLTHGFFSRIAGTFRKCLVDLLNDFACIGNHHGFLRLKSSCRDTKIGFAPLAFADVAPDTLHPDRHPIPVSQRADQFQRYLPPRFVGYLQFIACHLFFRGKFSASHLPRPLKIGRCQNFTDGCIDQFIASIPSHPK